MALSDAMRKKISQSVDNKKSGVSSAGYTASRSNSNLSSETLDRIRKNVEYKKINNTQNTVDSVNNALAQFRRDSQSFLQNVERDMTEGSGFNAADYFEERKKQADQLKRRADYLYQLAESSADSFSPQSYDSVQKYLSSYGSMMDEVLGDYTPSITAKTGMRAYEDELIAAQERNDQLKKLDQQALFALDSTGPAYNMLQNMMQYRNDESYRGITDSWTDGERYLLGQYQAEDPAKARQFAIQVNNAHNAESTKESRENIRKNAVENKFGNTIGALMASTFTASGEFMDRISENMARGTTTEKSYVSPWDYAQEVTGAISEDLNQKYGTFNAEEAKRIRSELQNNVQGLVDNNAAGMDLAFGNGSDFVYDTLNEKGTGDLYNLGYSIAQNALNLYTVGAMGGQAAVLANYFMNAATSGIDEARKAGANGDQAIKSGVAKGALEVITELLPLDKLFDMGNAVTWGEFFKELGLSGLLGAFGEGANTALGYLSDQFILKDLSEYSRMVQEYMSQGMTEPQARQKAFRDAAMSTVYDAMTGAVSDWVSGGLAGTANTMLQNAAYSSVDANALVDAGMETAEGSNAFRKAMEMQAKLDANKKISGNDKRILARTIELQKTHTAADGTQDNAAPASEPAKTHSPAEAKPQVSKDGRAIQISKDSPVDVLDFASFGADDASVQLKDGKTANYNDIAFKDQQQANQFYTVRSLPGLDTDSANNLLHTIQDADGAKDTDSVVGIREAYGMGYYAQSESDLAAGDAAKLTPELRKAVFDIGVQQRQAQEKIQPRANAVTAKPTQGYKKITIEGNVSKVSKKADKKRQTELKYIDSIADTFAGTMVHVYESYEGFDGKRYYKDGNGVKHDAPNGRYVNGEIWLDINSGDNGEGLILNTFAHELYHHIERFNKKKANELASFVSRELGIENVESAVEAQIRKSRAAGYGEEFFIGNGMTETQAKNEVYSRAMSDFVADSLETMFTRGNPAEAISKLKTENRGLFDEIKAFIDKWVSKVKEFYKDKTISREGEMVSQLKNFEELQQLFMEALQSAGENYRAAMEEVVEKGADPVNSDDIVTDGAYVTDGEGTMYSIRSMKEDIAEGKMFEDLKNYCGWTQKQVDTLRDQLNDLVAYMTPFRDILDLNETYGKKGRRFSPYKPNSDPLYKISMDFSTLCSKRLLTQYVIENLQLRENRPMSAEEQMAIRDMLNEYRKQKKGLQVACAMCYVEAARLKSPKQMQKWMNDPETYMRNYFADKDPDFAAYIKGKQEDFKESRGYARNTPKKDMSSKDVSALNKIRPRLRSEYKPSAGEQAIIEKAKSLPNSTYLTAANLANLSESDPTIYAAYTAFVRTATRSKSLETDEPYYYGDSRRDNGNGIVVTDAFIEEVNRENGMRFSSWSDWRIQHMLDYITAVIDNAVRGAAMHGYTKFPEEVRVLGKTGMMFNMSGVAGTQTGLNEDGSLSFSDTESINRDEAVQLREEFPDTAGLQCIGVSDEHIVELLKSDIIDYVIPYHVSGLNKGLRSMANIQGWKDYTATQHAAIDKNAKLADTKDQEHWHEEPVFSEFFVGYSAGMTGIDAMRASADKYKQMCADRGLKPKFEQFAKEPNYWKLLIDRKMINQKTGDLIQQKPVTPTFDFDTIKAVVDRHVDNYDSNMEARALNHIVENWDSIPKRIRDLKKQGGKKPAKKAIDNLSNQTLAAQPVDDAGMNSLRSEKLTNRDILSQIDITKRNKTEQWHLTEYRNRLDRLAEEQPKLDELQSQIKELEADGKKHPELAELRSQERKLRISVEGLKRDINKAEHYDMFQKIVEQERRKVDKQEHREALKTYKQEQKEAIETMQLEQRVLREELTGKESDISVMEREFVRIVKKYEQLENKAGKKSEKDAGTIAKLKTELKAEASAHKADSKIWDREFNRLLREYESSGRKIERLEETIKRQRETAKARVAGRKRTEMVHKIQRKVNELNSLLVHGSKNRNIPESLQPAVAAILDAINMEVRDGDQRQKTFEATLARYDRRIAMENDPEKVSELIRKRNEYEAKGDQFSNKMAELKTAYEKIQRDKNSDLEIEAGLYERLMTLFVIVGDTPLGKMNAEQLDAVNDVLNITMATVRNVNKMLAEERAAGVIENSKSVIREVFRLGGGTKKKTDVQKTVEKFAWNNLKPVNVFEVIGSETLKRLYDNLRNGEDTLAVDRAEAKKFFQEQWNRNNGGSWDMEKKWKFTSTTGKKFELDLNQIMSLYALAKRDQARSHLRVGGFAFDSDYKTAEEIKLGPVKFKVNMESTDASAYNLSDEILGEIIGALTAEQRKFVDAMQAYLSNEMAAKGNQVSLKKYGIRLFKEANYFPLRVADQFMAKVRERQTGDRKLANAGFTKEVTPEAKNPVVLSGFTEVWAEHVDEMSLYHSFVLPLDDFNRVLNYHDQFNEEQDAASVVQAIRNAYGKGATDYIDKLIRDINGGERGDSTANIMNSMMSKAKKAQTMASLSVAIQQPSSIIRAMSMIDGKYFIGPKPTEKTHNRTWEEIKAHAPIAMIKEMGGFDTNVGKTTVDYLTDTTNYNGFGEKFKAFFKDGDLRDDFFGKLPELMDELAWGVIWNAVKREQADLHPDVNVKSDAFMDMVAKRFTDVISHTQVYDSVFSRSGMMRSKDGLAKMATSFMAEPTTTANMMAVALIKEKRGEISKKEAARTVGAITGSLLLNSAFVSFIYALRDDDKEKRYGEKWRENFYSKFFESLDPTGYIPFIRDIRSMSKGFDIERTDMTLIGDLINAVKGLGNEDVSAWDKTLTVVGAVGDILGVPMKNIIRDTKGIIQTFGFAIDDIKPPKTKTGYYMARRGLDLSDGDEMILAIQRGDEEHIQRVFGRFEDQEDAERALQSAIGEKYRSGDMTAEEAQQMLTDHFDREDEYEVYWLFDKWDYAIEHGNTDGYTKMGAFLDAVENGGDYVAEMQRYLDHGSDISDIRSAISGRYKKRYMKADEAGREEIRNKLTPVFLETDMYQSDIDKEFNDWNFEAEYDYTYSAYKAAYRDGDVTEQDLRGAMKFYGLKNFEIDKEIRSLNEDIAFRKKYDMTLSEMKDAYDNGDIAKNTMKNAMVYSGMTATEAQDWIKKRDISNRYGMDYMELDDAYKAGDITRQTLYNSMIEAGSTRLEADEAIAGYDWLKRNYKRYPDLTIGDAKKFVIKIGDHDEEHTLADYGVTIDHYIQYSKLKPECKGVDANGDGKTDKGTLRDSIFRMIDSLPISDSEKDGLALISYSMKSIRENAPWKK